MLDLQFLYLCRMSNNRRNHLNFIFIIYQLQSQATCWSILASIDQKSKGRPFLVSEVLNLKIVL
jgi:hypothetical protein